MEDIEKLLAIENREKKQTARGIHGRASKIGKFAKKMVTPVDMLKGKEKRIYKGTGKVRTYNMYEEILLLEEFEKLSKEEQAKLLTEYRKRYTVDIIANTWKMKPHMVYYKFI